MRFFGAAKLDPAFYQKSFTKLAQEVIQHLASAEGAELEISIDGRIVCIDRTYVSRTRYEADTFDVEPSSGIADLRTRVRQADREESSLLKVSRSSPLLDITRVTYDHLDQPLHVLRRVVNPQRVHLVEHGTRLSAGR